METVLKSGNPSPPPGEGLYRYVRVRLYVCMFVCIMYSIVALRILVEKYCTIHEIDVKSSLDDDWVAANLVICSRVELGNFF